MWTQINDSQVNFMFSVPKLLAKEVPAFIHSFTSSFIPSLVLSADGPWAPATLGVGGKKDE